MRTIAIDTVIDELRRQNAELSELLRNLSESRFYRGFICIQ